MRPALRLQTWLSPAFPIGGFSYSHGLEYAVEAGLVRDADATAEWTCSVVEDGAGRVDAVLLAHAYRALARGSAEGLIEVAELASALRGTPELALESTAQGRAFLGSVRRAWPAERIEWAAGLLDAGSIPPALPVAVATAAESHDVPLVALAPLYLGAFAAAIVSAAVRLVPLGQSEALHILAGLEDAIAGAADRALTTPLQDVGSATPVVDWCSMQHETQRTRLFRS